MEHVIGQIAIIHNTDNTNIIGILSSDKDKQQTFIHNYSCLENIFSKPKAVTAEFNSNIKLIFLPSVTLNPPNSRKKIFIDSEVRKDKLCKRDRRELQPFFSGVELSKNKFGLGLTLNQDSDMEWDQFATNESLYNVHTSYTNDLYNAGLILS
jgi:hypothetical protein